MRIEEKASTNTLLNFKVVKMESTERRLRAYLEHDSMPLLIAMDISVEGSVVSWLGKALWNGDAGFPDLRRRARAGVAGRDNRADLVPAISI
jgi:hypothetical protein